jgi:hypothetical protein
MRTAFLSLILAGAMAGCAVAADTQPATAPATAASQPAALQPIRYQRTGGFAGTNDVIEITADGAVVVQGKLMGQAKGQLTADQIKELVPVFHEWDKYAASYPAPQGSADGFELKIRYGTKEVAASELNRTLPATFTRIREALEKIAADLKEKPK